MTEPTDLTRVRAELARRRPPSDLGIRRPATVLTATVRPLPAPRPRPPALARFHAWRRSHYAADQALRVAAILAGGFTAIALAFVAGRLAMAWLLGQVPGAVGALAVLAIGLALAVAAVARGRLRSAGGHSCSGLHCSGCRH